MVELLDSSTAELSGAAEDGSTVPADDTASLDKAVSLDAGVFPAFTSVETLLELLSAQAAKKNNVENIQTREIFFIRYSVSAMSLELWAEGLAVAEGVAYAAFHHIVTVPRGIIAYWRELFDGEFSITVQHGFVGGHVHDFAEQKFGFLVVAHHLAFQREREFGDQRGVHVFALDGGEARLCKLVRDLVAAGDSKVINSLDVLCRRHAHGESLAGKDVRHGLVALGHVDGNLVRIADAAPGGHHRVRGAVFVVCRDDERRLRVKVSLDSEIFAHDKFSSWSGCSIDKIQKKNLNGHFLSRTSTKLTAI